MFSHYSPPQAPQAPQESVSSNIPTTSRGKARRHRLPLEASKILDDYIQMPGFWEKYPTGMPNKSSRDQLLADIKKLPGTEFYKMVNLVSWFRYRRPGGDNSEDIKAASTSVSTSKGQTSHTRYHSLSTNAVTSLSTLCKDTPNPSQDTIALWIKFLHHETPGVTLEDVNRFLYDCHNPRAEIANRIDVDNDAIQGVGSNNDNSGLPTPGNTASPTIISSRPTWMTPDPFNVKTRNSRSPIPSVRSGSAPCSASVSGSVTESASSGTQPRTPTKLLGVSHPYMNGMDVDRYIPMSVRRRTPSEHPNVALTQTNVELPLSPSPQSRFRSSLSPPQMQMMGLVAIRSPPASESPLPPSRATSAQPEQEEEDDNDMDISTLALPTSAVVSLPPTPFATGTDSGILQTILQGLTSARDNTAPMEPAVACPTNKTEFDAAFAQFDSTCMMIGDMLNTREAHES